MKWIVAIEKIWAGDMLFEDTETGIVRKPNKNDERIHIPDSPFAVPTRMVFVGVASHNAESGETVRLVTNEDTFCVQDPEENSL